MNKQQLANKIWKSANQMRSKIEANEYKDFILGFMFYKYLSEKELAFFYSQDMTEADIQGMDETDTEFVEYTKDKIGYFIAYDNLFSTWISKKSDFDVSDVRNGLSAFSRLISPTKKKVFEKIFNTLKEKGGEEASAMEIEDLEIFENVSYIMAFHADPTIPKTIDEWLEQFEMFSIYEILPEILELWGPT